MIVVPYVTPLLQTTTVPHGQSHRSSWPPETTASRDGQGQRRFQAIGEAQEDVNELAQQEPAVCRMEEDLQNLKTIENRWWWRKRVFHGCHSHHVGDWEYGPF